MKISKITINNYRAFYNEIKESNSKYFINLTGGKNLLIYGENGSGKSSFYKALNDLFRSSVEPGYHFTENVFSRELELEEQPFIEVDFKRGKEEKTFTFSKDLHRINVNDELLRSVARGRSFMTYRELLRVHFIQDYQVNLFDFLFGQDGILADLTTPVYSRPETHLKMNALLEIVRTKPDEINLRDFTQSTNQILTDLNETLNYLLRYFDRSMKVSFSQLTEESLSGGHPEIKVNVSYFGIDLNLQREQYHHFLNEARLSALAVCIFLAAHLSVPSPDYKVLFLDDIFTGLDNSNRIPLLDILTDPIIQGTMTKTFTDHQIFLTTYDRQWYELAKNHLENNKWSFQEMYIDRHSKGFDHPAWLPGDNDIEKALHYFRIKQYASCANYQRKICERLIKKFLPDSKKYDPMPSGEIKPIDQLGTLIDRFENHLTENKLDFSPYSKIRLCLRAFMNPLSHDDNDSPFYRRELELGFELIKKLQVLKNEICFKKGQVIRTIQKNGESGDEFQYDFEIQNTVWLISTENEKAISQIVASPIKRISLQDNKDERLGYPPETLEKNLKKIRHYLKNSETVEPNDSFEWEKDGQWKFLNSLLNTKTE
ncbi:AAA family ATPase [Flavobacterium aestivum]|uniref:AAA family ATPase n=1 Tax=Flavobacterium aestivum TaxID=3003257 RepID=UPI002482D650|nr:AAA family ATPase [Flavobacterium aestivum]